MLYENCRGLTENGPHRLVGSSIVRRRSLVGVVVVLLEGMCHWGRARGFRCTSQAQCHPFFLLLATADAESHPLLQYPVCLGGALLPAMMLTD